MSGGMIYDIKEFAVHDGPGIRITIFLKGCPLNCVWCHNPEGISYDSELMVSKSSCINCGNCIEVCQSPGQCRLCGDCIDVCPLDLRKIVGMKVSAEEVADRIKKDSDFYKKSGGGVTFSGGEPLAQADFLFAVLDKLDDIHTAIETSGFTSESIFKRALSKLDLIIFDIKQTDELRHKEYTGVDNKIILNNLKILCNHSDNFIIRLPLIPGVNDNRENIENAAKLLQGARGLQRVEMLPYHKTAGAKYSMLGREYSPPFNTEQEVKIHKEIFDLYGIRSEVL